MDPQKVALFFSRLLISPSISRFNHTCWVNDHIVCDTLSTLRDERYKALWMCCDWWSPQEWQIDDHSPPGVIFQSWILLIQQQLPPVSFLVKLASLQISVTILDEQRIEAPQNQSLRGSFTKVSSFSLSTHTHTRAHTHTHTCVCIPFFFWSTSYPSAY